MAGSGVGLCGITESVELVAPQPVTVSTVRKEDELLRLCHCKPHPGSKQQYMSAAALPDVLSSAVTFRMPLASTSNATLICGTPRGAGGIPDSSNLPSRLLSRVI